MARLEKTRRSQSMSELRRFFAQKVTAPDYSDTRQWQETRHYQIHAAAKDAWDQFQLLRIEAGLTHPGRNRDWVEQVKHRDHILEHMPRMLTRMRALAGINDAIAPCIAALEAECDHIKARIRHGVHGRHHG